jgi:hypothetical protein
MESGHPQMKMRMKYRSPGKALMVSAMVHMITVLSTACQMLPSPSQTHFSAREGNILAAHQAARLISILASRILTCYLTLYLATSL